MSSPLAFTRANSERAFQDAGTLEELLDLLGAAGASDSDLPEGNGNSEPWERRHPACSEEPFCQSEQTGCLRSQDLQRRT